ncbi:hypothetical protein OG874_16905 [Nocardia sp. NBC_00565]|uniref:hypothetical protein n=1 Tax=Nocardia sp. NBC_00565 TaxID=2975993 RepID=UPI002E8140BE|nr:hypothetical protein [Nocardia sp. NBC_00565]WUC06692.1 hypothetical protein OG874_16905 [Nocardia sp. NBC_00565]
MTHRTVYEVAEPDIDDLVSAEPDVQQSAADEPDVQELAAEDDVGEKSVDTKDSDGARASKRPRAALLIAALSVLVLVTLAVSATLLAAAHRDSDAAGDRDLALLGAVRQEVVNLISPSVKDPGGSADRIAKDATGQWLTEFQGTKDRFVGAISESKTESVGEILGAGIERHNGDGSTTVLVSAVSKVTNAAGAKDDPRTWRLRVEIVEIDGRYKLSKVEVVP